jgi:CRP-like cAMP-binding protein
MKLEQGDFFGDIELFFNNKVRKYNVKTYTDCELYILPKENLDNIFEKFFVIKTNFL